MNIRALTTLVLYAWLIALPGCGPSVEETRLREAEGLVARSMRDPTSAQFRNMMVFASGAVCGEVNAKNGFGGYVGFDPFIVTSAERVYVASEERNFRSLHDAQCR